ncbi:MAG TPA: acetylxylan esterase [Candidatus Brocadiia bacterium]|nr:acetylxylan esterase [Candidatus Brocadiia bacterium]
MKTSPASAAGPWRLGELRRLPAMQVEQTAPGRRRIYYENEPLEGRPTRVYACYACPPGAREKLPAMVLIHGGGGRAFPEWTELWAGRGYAAIAMDLGGKDHNGQSFDGSGPGQDHTDKFDAIARGVEHAWPYHAVAAVLRATTVLAAQPEVDPARIGATGISWGGYLASLVAGLDDRLRFSIPVYGCGFLGHNSAWLPNFASLGPSLAKLWLDHFDPSVYLPRARCPMFWVTGTNDFAYPLDSHRMSCRAAPGPRTLRVTVKMPHGHSSGWAPAEIGLFADSLLKGGRPLPRLGPLQVSDGAVETSFDADVPLFKAQLHNTTDTGPWQTRNWATVPAEIIGNRVRATLPPQRPLVAFLTVTDSRQATVSTEYEEIL